METTRPAFRGKSRKLVLAFDVGTTCSGISYSVLDPGVIPEIQGVNRFPAHEYIGGASKIPTIIYYDSLGKVKAVGAEAVKEGIYETAEDEHWVKAEWFKLHLRSQVGAGKELSHNIPPLPPNKKIVEVFADFLAYLLECASSYIQDTHANGEQLWESAKDEIHFVLSHPNGWEGAQQAQMRKAAVLEKLVPDTTAGLARLSFVTEGEASLHFAVKNGLPIGVMENGQGVVIVDAGGVTIDISSYAKNTGKEKNRFGEVSPPQGHFHGSVFVTTHSRIFLENYLQDSTFLPDLDHIVGCFDKTTKLRFRNSNEPQYIKFGGTRDNDQNCNIRFGELKLLGSDVAEFFEPSVEAIVTAVLDQCKAAQKPISNTQVSERKEFRKSYCSKYDSKNGFKNASTLVWCYRGAAVRPKWKDVDPENYTPLCTLGVDFSRLPVSLQNPPSGEGTIYCIDYDIIPLFGLTELKALIAWQENGVERRSEVRIIYDGDCVDNA